MRVRIEPWAQAERPIADARDRIILAAGAAIVFTSGVVQLILPLFGIESAWPTGIALALDGAFLPILSRIMWKAGIFKRKKMGMASHSRGMGRMACGRVWIGAGYYRGIASAL